MLSLDRAAIRALCRRHHIHRLALFGSAVTDRFDPARSDADFLVEFEPGDHNSFDAYFGLKEDLESLLDRPVDLVTPNALENPYFAASVNERSVELYRAPEARANQEKGGRP